MGVSYAIDGKLVTISLEGTYEPQDIIRTFVDAMDDPRSPDRAALLLDVTRSESLSGRSPDEIRLVAEFLGPYAERIGGRCAVVAAKDVHFGLSRMGSVYTDGVGVKAEVFRDTESALEWLGATAA
jgi:hypothetical protein